MEKKEKKKSDRVRDMLEYLAIGITMLFGLTILAGTIAYLIIYHTDLFA